MAELNGKSHGLPSENEALQKQLEEAATQLMGWTDRFRRLQALAGGPKMVSWLKGEQHVVIIAPQVLTEELLRRVAEGTPVLAS